MPTDGQGHRDTITTHFQIYNKSKLQKGKLQNVWLQKYLLLVGLFLKSCDTENVYGL